MTISNLNSGQFIAHHPTTGKPLAFGKVYFFEPGTTTPKATYTDRTAATQQPHPVILSARGTARIFLDGAYDLRIDDANDVTVETLADVYGALDEASVADAIASAAASVTLGFGTISVTADINLSDTAAAKLVLVDASGGNITIGLPAAASMVNKAPITILRTDSSGNTVTIDPNASETIGGAATQALPARNLAALWTDGSAWYDTGRAPIDGIAIGGAVPAAGAFTSLSASGAVNFVSGAMNGVTIGASARAPANVTNLSVTGNAVIEKDNPSVFWRDTSGSVATHSASRWVQTDIGGVPVFALETLTDAGAFVSSDYVLYKGASGAIEHQFLIEGTEGLSITSTGAEVNGFLIATGTVTSGTNSTSTTAMTGDIYPSVGAGGNAHNVGTALRKFSNGYFVNFTTDNPVVVVSDARRKTPRRDLLPEEIRVGQRLKGLIGIYSLIDSPDKKHPGVIAQEVIAAFAAEGLRWQDYSVVTGSEEDGYGVRYDALLALVIGSL